MAVIPWIRDELPEDVLVFDNFAYDSAIIGVSTDDRVVYDYNQMLADLVLNEHFTLEEAAEWIDYNTIRSLPYAGENGPIIVYPIVTYNYYKEQENREK